MEICGCKTKCDCTFFSVIVSVIVGIIVAFLNVSGTIAVPQVVLWVFFGVALAALAAAFVAGALQRREHTGCFCSSLTTLLVGVLGTVLFSLVLILADIATGGIFGSLITGLLFAAFTLIITSVGCLTKSLFGCK